MFFDLKITRKKANTDEDEVVYQASRFEDIIAKSWRDVALSALVAGGKENEAIVAEIVKRVEKSNPQSKQRFMSFLRTAGSESISCYKEESKQLADAFPSLSLRHLARERRRVQLR